MAVTAVVGAVLAAGVSAQQSRAQGIHAAQESRNVKAEQSALQAKAQQQQQQTELSQAQSAAQARNRAMAASNATYGGTSEPMLGNLGDANTKRATLLGL